MRLPTTLTMIVPKGKLVPKHPAGSDVDGIARDSSDSSAGSYHEHGLHNEHFFEERSEVAHELRDIAAKVMQLEQTRPD